MIRNSLAALSCLWIIVFSIPSHAELTVDVTLGVENSIPIAIVPFGGPQGGSDENLASIIAADLARSGRFKVLPESQMLELPSTPEQVQFATWKTLGQDNLGIGQVRQTGTDRYEAQFELFDAVRGIQLANSSLPYTTAESRKTAHRIADIIYKQLTGEDGAFASRIAYVTVSPGSGLNDRRYTLQVADADGFNPQAVVNSPEPIMSPAWSPDGKKIAYVSFENKRPAIFVQTLSSREREKVSELPGINGAPAWSPDGTQLALTLSKDGNPEIYVMDLTNRSLLRVTDHFAIDTEPAWSRDGKQLVFTSDRGGKPQLYSVASTGGQPRRITFEGDYNARGAFSPDGKSLVMVHGNGGDYRIAVLDMASKQLRVLTPGSLDESPSFAPNGSMILYASQNGERAGLSTLSSNGKVREGLRIKAGEAREPAWSP
ncbi:MAG: Tol-Pal system beta propeller repeat protein TolB [Proteobacteria bacterium]|nr:Tol-Pal system beta propeller repeat protein TolB [Pseudomonadota bacterium]